MQNSVDFAREIRIRALTMNHHANASHSGGALSMSDILAVLYQDILRIFPDEPKHPDRDRFLLSKGHACSALYAALSIKGFFDEKLLESYSHDGSKFITHVSHHIPGVELSTGSLGHALSVACGIALAGKRNMNSFRVFALVSDGELDEGSNWESILFAPHHKLDNLRLIVDYNKIQSIGTVKEVLDLDPLMDKFIAFGWETFEVNGHDHKDLLEIFKKADCQNSKPKVIIAHTIKGKGVDYMENTVLWHYRSPDKNLLEEAVRQLRNDKSK
jgi:transketolase